MDLPVEFLRDPSAWLDAGDVENFLNKMDQRFASQFKGENTLLTRVGHEAPDLKSWGVLDSVLRMMPKTSDLYAQPQRFLSYFISPEPTIEHLEKSDQAITFAIQFAAQEYPHTAEYLKAALESLPNYQGQPMTHVHWYEQRIVISWSEEQSTLFEREESSQLKPDYINSLVGTLEAAQKQIEQQKKQIALKEAELARVVQIESFEPHKQHVLRLKDYFHRAQQLVTLLVGQGRADRQIQEALKRTDWSHTVEQFTSIANVLIQSFEQKKPALLNQSEHINPSGEDAKSTDLNQLIEEVVDDVGRGEGRRIKFEKMLFLDRPVKVRSLALKRAIHSFLQGRARSLGGKSRIRVVTRPVSGQAEIEISEIRANETTPSDVSQSDDTLYLEQMTTEHSGRFNCQDRGFEGSTVVIQLPT